MLRQPQSAAKNISANNFIANGALSSDSDSEVDFEEMGPYRKLPVKVVGGAKLPSKQNLRSPLHVRERVSRASKKAPLIPFQRSRSHELLLDQPQDCYDSSGSQESGVGYALPFQHLQNWRRMVGLEDSSVLTGSLPSLHDLDVESDNLCYITPNEFRSFVSHVRGESIKMGHRTSQRAMNRVDSFVKSRLSQTFSALSNRPEYLSLMDDELIRDKSPKHQKTKPLPQIPPKKKKPVNYENQSGVCRQKKEKNFRVELPISVAPLSPPMEECFDDPVYDQSIKSNRSYIYEDSPSPPPTHLLEPPEGASDLRMKMGSQYPQGTWAGYRTPSPKLEDKKSHTVSSPIPKRKPRLFVRESEPVLSRLPSSAKINKPVPKPRRKMSKPDLLLEMNADLFQTHPQEQPHPQRPEEEQDAETNNPKPPVRSNRHFIALSDFCCFLVGTK